MLDVSRGRGRFIAGQSFRWPIVSGSRCAPGDRHHRVDRHRLALGHLGQRWSRCSHCVPVPANRGSQLSSHTTSAEQRVALARMPCACAGEMGAACAPQARRAHTLEGRLPGAGVPCMLSLPEAVIARGAAKTAVRRAAGSTSAGPARTSNERVRKARGYRRGTWWAGSSYPRGQHICQGYLQGWRKDQDRRLTTDGERMKMALRTFSMGV